MLEKFQVHSSNIIREILGQVLLWVSKGSIVYTFQQIASLIKQVKGEIFTCRIAVAAALFHILLKDKSGVHIIVDYSRDYTVVNGV